MLRNRFIFNNNQLGLHRKPFLPPALSLLRRFPQSKANASKPTPIGDEKPIPKHDVTERLKLFKEQFLRIGHIPLGLSRILVGILNNNTKAVIKELPPPLHDDLYSLLYDKNFILYAYTKLSKNKGSTTKGTSEETADGMNLERLDLLHTKLKSRSFRFQPFRRVWFDKAGKKPDSITKKIPQRPLGIPNFEDRIVQEMIRTILETIYEPWFEKIDSNYGFRSYCSPHDAMIKIQYQSQQMSYAIEGDIKGAFDNVVPSILMKFLNKRIIDKEFLSLISQGFSCGLMEFGAYKHTVLGTPQGGIASPILFNIYLYEFDEFVTNEISKFFNEKNRKENRSNDKKVRKTNLYFQYDQKARKLLNRSYFNALTPEQLEELDKLKKARAQISSINRLHRQLLKFSYVRYADDWILTTNASESVCQELKEILGDFLLNTLKLTLSPDKTKITNLNIQRAKFLGFTIHNNKITDTYTKVTRPDKILVYRNKTRRQVVIDIDTERILSRMHLKRYCTTKGYPTECPALSIKQPQEIIDHYNSVMIGMSNYYWHTINCKSHINRLTYILQYSCLKTLSQHIRRPLGHIFKHRSYLDKSEKEEKQRNYKNKNQRKDLLRAVFPYELDGVPKYAVLLNYREIVSRLRVVAYNRKVIPYTGSLIEDFFSIKTVNWRTSFKLTTCCIACGSTEKIESHHIRSVKKNPQAVGFERLMAILQRRQIPICRYCHLKIHKGEYNGIQLSELYDTRVATCESIISNPFSLQNQFVKSKVIKLDIPYIFDHDKKIIYSNYQQHWSKLERSKKNQGYNYHNLN